MDSREMFGVNLPESITKRDRERKNVIERKREEKQQSSVDSEQLSYFEKSFYASCKMVKDLLDSTSTTQIAALPSLFDKVNKEIQILWNYLSQSKIFLKVYDIRKAQETLQQFETEATELELKYLPKKKFGFKNRRVVKKPLEKTLDITDGLMELKLTEGITNNSMKIANSDLINKYSDSASTLIAQVDKKLILDAENVNKNDVLLSDLTRCTVKIFGTPSTVHMVNLKQCTILIGPVTGSVFGDNCIQSTLVFACQQMRLHTSTDCTIYLHVTSRAIIEDCNKIKVAPYNWSYDDQTNHYHLAGLDIKINNWDSIDDFNWLSYEKHSPNWSVLKVEHRIKNWD